jgi:glycosyltransferase involved in cell wall biosynthesis
MGQLRHEKDACAAVLKVSYFFRAQSEGYSLEEAFSVIRDHLPGKFVHTEAFYSSRSAASPVAILRNGFEARARQSRGVNHITGDVLYLALFLDGCRTVLTIPDVGVLHRESGARRAALQSLWFDAPERKVAAVTTISEAAKKDICETLGWPAGRVEVIPVAISGRFRFKPKAHVGRRARILQVGTTENKNVHRVIAALAGLPVTLTVIGRLTTKLKEALARGGVEYEVRYGLSSAEMVAEYERCDLVVFASTHEGFGMPILEAQAVGRAVVTSDRSSMPEVAGEGARYVDPLSVSSIREGVCSILENPSGTQKLIEAGLQNKERFSPEHVARQYLELYRRVATQMEV